MPSSITRLVEAKLKAKEASAEAPFLYSVWVMLSAPKVQAELATPAVEALPAVSRSRPPRMSASRSWSIRVSIRAGEQHPEQNRPKGLVEQAQADEQGLGQCVDHRSTPR